MNLEGQFKAFIIEGGGLEPKGPLKLVTNDNIGENEYRFIEKRS